MNGHRRFQHLASIVAAALLVPVAAPAQQASKLPEIAPYQGPDREKRLVEGAKKEGELMFYSSIPVEDIAVLTAGFRQEIRRQGQGLARGFRRVPAAHRQRGQGPPLRGRRDGGVELGDRAAVSREATERGEVALSRRPDPGSRSRRTANGPRSISTPSCRPTTPTWCRRKSLPKTYQDLLQPEFKGKLGIEAEDFDWFAQVVIGLGEAAGPQAVPRHRRDQRHFGAQGPHAAEQPGGGRRSAARADGLRLHRPSRPGRRARRSTGSSSRR